jgi:hypothetical protein
MRKLYNHYLLPKWARKARGIMRDLSVPFVIYQAFRFLLFPNQADFILLLLFIIIALLLWMEII